MSIRDSVDALLPVFAGVQAGCEMSGGGDCEGPSLYRVPCPSCSPGNKHGAGLCEKHYQEIISRKQRPAPDRDGEAPEKQVEA